MNFKELYKIAEDAVASKSVPKPVTFEFLREHITQDKSLIEQLDVWRVVYQPPIEEARFTLFDERESLHDEPVYYAEVSFCASLESNPPHLLYALIKELMHVFDPMETWINTREKFIQFLKDLQNTPLEMANGSIEVEHKAKWMAILALCPQTLRTHIVTSVNKKGVLKEEIAQELGLPRLVIEIALDDYYEKALALLT
ncbi:hypothetical protein [Sphingomonas sp. LM7]|uniref:hypothetical protein n=1 Tax=Sphingomonas sp. LM7 TaxID=1938607 RepID=UPI000983BA1F|nr:hypothetical protein [Sphingomonas sp. LM7]AQR74936.1 hypothetical protein BXU08_15825 [Sphingomonas sp. LM7]